MMVDALTLHVHSNNVIRHSACFRKSYVQRRWLHTWWARSFARAGRAGASDLLCLFGGWHPVLLAHIPNDGPLHFPLALRTRILHTHGPLNIL